MTNPNNNEITVTREGDISFVCLNRPQHNNTLTFSLLKKLEEIALGFSNDIETKAVIMCAKGEHFSFGADLSDILAERAADTPLVLRRRQMQQGANLLKAIRNIPQITVCAVQGRAVGGAAAIASACDFRIGSKDSQISYGEVRLGMNLMWQAMPLCVQLIGPARAKKMIMSGLPETAETLLNWGFFDEVTPRENLNEAAVKMAEIYTALPPVAVQAIKHSINAYNGALSEAVMHMDMDQFILLQESEDAREGLMALAENRSGKFTGR